MNLAYAFDLSTIEPELGAPSPGRLIAGDPRFRTWNFEETPAGLYAGVWESTPGKWAIVYEEWEYFRILSGRSIVTGEDGSVFHLGPGDSLVLRPGFKGSWEVLETTRKDYVIKL